MPQLEDFPKYSPDLARQILQDAEDREIEQLLAKEESLGRQLSEDELDHYFSALPSNRDILINHAKQPDPQQQDFISSSFSQESKPARSLAERAGTSAKIATKGIGDFASEIVTGTPEFVGATLPSIAGAGAEKLGSMVSGGQSTNFFERQNQLKKDIEKNISRFFLTVGQGGGGGFGALSGNPQELASVIDEQIKQEDYLDTINLFQTMRDANSYVVEKLDKYLPVSPEEMAGDTQIPVVGPVTEFIADKFDIVDKEGAIVKGLTGRYSNEAVVGLAGAFVGQMGLLIASVGGAEGALQKYFEQGFKKVGKANVARQLQAGVMKGMKASGVNNQNIRSTIALMNQATQLGSEIGSVSTASTIVGLPLTIIQATDKKGEINWEDVGKYWWIDTVLPAAAVVGGKGIKSISNMVKNPEGAFAFSQSTKRLAASVNDFLGKSKNADQASAAAKLKEIELAAAEAEALKNTEIQKQEGVKDIAAETGEKIKKQTGDLEETNIPKEEIKTKTPKEDLVESQVKSEPSKEKPKTPLDEKVEAIKSETKTKIEELKTKRAQVESKKEISKIDRQINQVREEGVASLKEYRTNQSRKRAAQSRQDKQINTVKDELADTLKQIEAKRSDLETRDLVNKERKKLVKQLDKQEELARRASDDKIRKIEQNTKRLVDSFERKAQVEAEPTFDEAKARRAAEDRLAAKRQKLEAERKVQKAVAAKDATARKTVAKEIKERRKIKKELKKKFKNGDIVQAGSTTGRFKGKAGNTAYIKTSSGRMLKVNRNAIKGLDRGEPLLKTLKSVAKETFDDVKSGLKALSKKSSKKSSKVVDEVKSEFQKDFNKRVRGDVADQKKAIELESKNPKEIAEEFLKTTPKDESDIDGVIDTVLRETKAFDKESLSLDIGKDAISGLKGKAKTANGKTIDELIEKINEHFDDKDWDNFDLADVRNKIIDRLTSGSYKKEDPTSLLRERFKTLTGKNLTKKIAQEISEIDSLVDIPKTNRDLSERIKAIDEELDNVFEAIGKGDESKRSELDDLLENRRVVDELDRQVKETLSYNNRAALDETREFFKEIDDAVLDGRMSFDSAKKTKQKLLKAEDDMRELVDLEDLQFERDALALEVDELNNKLYKTDSEEVLKSLLEKERELDEFARLYGDKLDNAAKKGLLKADDEIETGFKKLSKEQEKFRKSEEGRSELEDLVLADDTRKFDKVRCTIG